MSAWSVKLVKSKNPYNCQSIPVISGSPDYSYGINDSHADIQKTGTAVLGIWNERVNIAKDTYEPLRYIILIRNLVLLEFTLHETEIHRFNTSEYLWKKNKKGNLEGYESLSRKHMFTWQPQDSQFTIKYHIVNKIKFSIKRPPMLNFNDTMEQIGYNDNWISIF